jgi:hypothetical protein
VLFTHIYILRFLYFRICEALVKANDYIFIEGTDGLVFEIFAKEIYFSNCMHKLKPCGGAIVS